ncbi:MAG: transcriptional repressor [Candidatus Acetothermia bacterium]|nr:transcriptional repressor [Candidatus Acetothermia bacterium]
MSNWQWTRKRHQVMTAIQGRTDHPTAEEVYQTLHAQGHHISLATVYRTLRALAGEGLVRELRCGGADRFDPNPSPHYHFLCTRCRLLFDVDAPYQTQLDHLLHHDHGFRIQGHMLIFYGWCPTCQEKEA